MGGLPLLLILIPLPGYAAGQHSTGAIDYSATVDGQHYVHVYIYRPPQHMGWGDAAILRLDGKRIVRIGNGKRVCLRLEPGKHTLDLNDRVSSLSLDVNPDQQYYVRVTERLGGCCTFQGRLKTVDPQQATKEYNQQRPVEEKSKMTREPLFDFAAP